MPTKKTKECPFCWEEILESAKKCKHCWEFLDESMRPAEVKQTVQQPVQVIPYNSKLIVDCPNCWYSWKPNKETPGNFWVELLLWLLMILPWFIYTCWRLCSTKTCKCPKCWNQMLSIHRG